VPLIKNTDLTDIKHARIPQLLDSLR